MGGMTTRSTLAATAFCLSAVVITACATTASAPVRRAPVYAAPVSAESVEAQILALPTERVATLERTRSPGLEAAERDLVRRLAGYGYSPRLEPIPWPDEATPAGWNNIIVEIPGNTNPDEVLIVCAHFDAVRGSPGADDNASGVAGVMEIARRLSSPAFAAQTKRTVRFALFNVEEEGLDGSFEHARLAELRAGEERIVGVINLEMIGYFTDAPNSQRSPIPRIPGVFEPPTVGDTITLVANQASSAFARELNELMRAGSPSLKTFLVDFIPGNGDAVPDTQRSDHAPFWFIGVPAVMVTDTSNFRNPHYHQPSDTIETLDLPRTAQVVEGVEHAVRVMSGASSSRTTQ
jgi:hypothetical protein